MRPGIGYGRAVAGHTNTTLEIRYDGNLTVSRALELLR